MTIFDERPAPPLFRCRRLPLLLLPAIVLLGWAALFLSHRLYAWQPMLGELRSEVSAVDDSPNYGVNTALIIRRGLLLHSRTPLSAAQAAALTGLVVSPVEEQSQSEALDVLGLAARAHTLSAAQAREAQTATLLALSRGPTPMVRLEAARLLGHLELGGSAPALTQLKQDPDPKVRRAAEEALARGTGTESAGASLCLYLDIPRCLMYNQSMSSQFPQRGSVPTLILAVLSDAPRHGYAIAREIERRSQNALKAGEGSLYPALRVLETDGLVVGTWEIQPSGPARKVYSLTDDGRAELAKRTKAWKEYTGAVDLVLEGA